MVETIRLQRNTINTINKINTNDSTILVQLHFEMDLTETRSKMYVSNSIYLTLENLFAATLFEHNSM